SHSCHTFFFLFLFHAPPSTEIYTLSLHDALPIFGRHRYFILNKVVRHGPFCSLTSLQIKNRKSITCLFYDILWRFAQNVSVLWRSEEHTSELQSRFDLVCRLLLEKKKKKQ